MITKPEDAVPHEAFVEITPENGHPHTEIVDSQAQKIAEQAEEIERLKEQVKVNARQVHDAAQLKL